MINICTLFVYERSTIFSLFIFCGFSSKAIKELEGFLKKMLGQAKSKSRSGAAASSLPKCRFFDQMAFLHEKSANKSTESNVTVNIPTSEVISAPSCSEDNYFPLNSPTSSLSSSSGSTKPPSSKRKKNSIETSLTKSLMECDDALKNISAEDKNEDSLFCKSLIPILKDLPLQKRRYAKVKMSQLLYEIQYDDTM